MKTIEEFQEFRGKLAGFGEKIQNVYSRNEKIEDDVEAIRKEANTYLKEVGSSLRDFLLNTLMEPVWGEGGWGKFDNLLWNGFLVDDIYVNLNGQQLTNCITIEIKTDFVSNKYLHFSLLDTNLVEWRDKFEYMEDIKLVKIEKELFSRSKTSLACQDIYTKFFSRRSNEI